MLCACILVLFCSSLCATSGWSAVAEALGRLPRKRLRDYESTIATGLQRAAGISGQTFQRITVIARDMWRRDCVRSFYKDIMPRVLRIAPCSPCASAYGRLIYGDRGPPGGSEDRIQLPVSTCMGLPGLVNCWGLQDGVYVSISYVPRQGDFVIQRDFKFDDGCGIWGAPAAF